MTEKYSLGRKSLSIRIVGFFAIGFILLGVILAFTALANNRRIEELYASRVSEEQLVLERDNESMLRLSKAFAPDYSQWDDPYNYLLGKFPNFAEKNLTEDTLGTFESDAVWMYKTDGTKVFEKNLVEDTEGKIDFAPYYKNIQELFKKDFLIEFNVKTKTGYMAIFGATVVQTGDSDHSTKSPGFLLVGKVINDETLAALQDASRNLVRFVPAVVSEGFPDRYPAKSGLLAYEMKKYDLKGEYIGKIYANYLDDSIRILHNSDLNLMVLNMSSFLLLLISLLVVVWRWVIKPMSRLYKGLETVDRELVQKMMHDTTEFGKIAELIDRFFEQEKSLEADVEEKKKLLTRLAAYNTEIEMTNNVMIGREMKMIEMKKELEEVKKQKAAQSGE